MTAIAEQIHKYKQSTDKLSRSPIRFNTSDEEQTDHFLDEINDVRLPLDEIRSQLKAINELLLTNFNQLLNEEVDFLLNLAPDLIDKTKSVINNLGKDVRFNLFKNCLSELTGEINHFEEIMQDIEKRYRPDTVSEQLIDLLTRISKRK